MLVTVYTLDKGAFQWAQRMLDLKARVLNAWVWASHKVAHPWSIMAFLSGILVLCACVYMPWQGWSTLLTSAYLHWEYSM